jgi:hypothetical protein
MVAWDGTDFVEISSGYVDGPASSTDNAVARFDGTDGKTIQNSVVIIADTTGNMSGVGTLGVGAITTSGALVGAVSQDAFNTVSTTLNLGGAATTVNIGAATGTLTVANTTLAAKAITASTTLGVTGVTTLSNLTASQAVFTNASKNLVSNAITGTGNVVMSTSPTLVTPALGTPSSGVVTNLTGTASININGTVGATTANTGAFTTLSTTGAVTITGGTANGVAYLDGSKVLTTGSALTFDGTGNLTCAATNTGNSFTLYTNSADGGNQGYAGNARALFGGSPPASSLGLRGEANVIFGISSTQQMILNSSGLEVKQSQLIGYSSYAGIGTNGLAVAGNVGIGTASPAALLHLSSGSGTKAIWGTTRSFTVNRNWQIAVDEYAEGLFTITPSTTLGGTTFTTPAMCIDSSGNLGIGTTTPNGKLELSGTGPVIFRLNDTATNYWQLESNSYLAFNRGGSEAMRLDASRNLLVGATSNVYSYKQEITGTSASSPFLGLAVYNTSASQGAKIAFLDNANSAAVGNLAGDLVFYAAGRDNERARIDSSGNLFVGTTTANSGVSLFPSFSSAGSSGIDIKHVSTAASGEYYITFQYNNGVIGTITQAGTTGVLYNVTSDYRLKTVIGPVADAGQRIDALQPVEYTWNAGGSRTRGFLAHQFQEVYAGSVTGTKDAVDAEGKPKYQAMQASSSEVIADLVAEIQSLRKRLAAAGI